tara:strand:- start:514 stop:639 length:126 start_codon:yes stop_codon:yes gene_type:complete
MYTTEGQKVSISSEVEMGEMTGYILEKRSHIPLLQHRTFGF